MLRPELSDPAVEAACEYFQIPVFNIITVTYKLDLSCVRDLHHRYLAVVTRLEQNMAGLLAVHTNHLNPPQVMRFGAILKN